jgi:uncharacterized membrane protein YphA (DoxX/SURF4 family)
LGVGEYKTRLLPAGPRGRVSRAGLWIGWLLGLVPAGVLLYAAFLKGLDPTLFAEQIAAHKITPAAWSPALAHFFIGVELLLGVALVLRLWPRLTHLGFVALMLGFIATTSIAWASGNARECGCFGRAAARGPKAVIIEDAMLIVVSLVCLWLLRKAKTSPRATIAGLVLVLPILAFTALGGRLPADALVTGVTPGTDLSDMQVEDLRTPHTEGWNLLVLVDGDCAACAEAVPRLTALARDRNDLAVAAVFSGTRQEAMAWRLKQLPGFPVAHASPRALRAYYRTLPSAFLLENGCVVRTWWNRIPEGSEVTAFLPRS